MLRELLSQGEGPVGGNLASSSFLKKNLPRLAIVKYVLKRVSFGSKDCTKELKLECAYFLGQTS